MTAKEIDKNFGKDIDRFFLLDREKKLKDKEKPVEKDSNGDINYQN